MRDQMWQGRKGKIVGVEKRKIIIALNLKDNSTEPAAST